MTISKQKSNQKTAKPYIEILNTWIVVTYVRPSGIPIHPTLSALATVLLLYGACVRGYHGFRSQWAQFTGCVSVNANTSLVTPSGRCGARRMYQTFADMVAANCSNCDNARSSFEAIVAAGCDGPRVTAACDGHGSSQW
ncbi:uncharacterized protein LOC142585166 isoform X2 [Dermacentor variabilis]|uniref:uncharacterized protein LOC142585166 isoform X2 n=1 Tax=Dermacentor variabilis TaxID=34621 RepID=UPI003F5BA1BE